MFRSIVGFASALIAANAVAPHSYTKFDDQRTIEIEGVLMKAAWQMPHSKLEVQVTDAAGNVSSYDIETVGGNSLRRLEVPLEIYPVGSTVKVAGWPSKRSTVRLYGTNLLSADGRETVLWRSQPLWAATGFGTAPVVSDAAVAAAPPATSIFQIWGSGYARPGIPDDPDASPAALFRVPLPLTAAGKARAAQYDPVTHADQRRRALRRAILALFGRRAIALFDRVQRSRHAHATGRAAALVGTDSRASVRAVAVRRGVVALARPSSRG